MHYAWITTAFLSITSLFCITSSQAQVAINCDGLTSHSCAAKVLHILRDPNTSVNDAIAAWNAWSAVYERAYRNLANAPVPPSDLDRIEGEIADKIDDMTNPANIALDAAMEKLLPKLAAIIGLTEHPLAQIILNVFLPSPTATPLQEMAATNEVLSEALSAKLAPVLRADWRSRYSSWVKDIISTLPPPPKP